MTPEDVDSYKEWAKRKVKDWHDDVKPDVVLLTETSAVPYGWLLKNAWKKMYSGEKVPKFYRSNIGEQRNDTLERLYTKPQILNNYLHKRSIDKSTRVLILDEDSQRPIDRNAPDFHKPRHIVKGGIVSRDDLNRCQSNTLMQNVEFLSRCNREDPGYLGDFKEFFSEGGISDIWTDCDLPCPFKDRNYLGDIRTKSKDEADKFYVKPTRKISNLPWYSSEDQRLFNFKLLVGTPEKDPELRKRALAYIHDLKLAGKEAGIEARQEQEKKKKLEQIVSGVLAFGGIGSSLFFLSSSVTGNAIGNISQSSGSWIGIVLLVIGLISGFFWLKNRKK